MHRRLSGWPIPPAAPSTATFTDDGAVEETERIAVWAAAEVALRRAAEPALLLLAANIAVVGIW